MKSPIDFLTVDYFNFSGRTGRKEYFICFLLILAASLICMFLDKMLTFTLGFLAVGIFTLILRLGIFIPSLAISVRRLHDFNKSGWWLLICLIPIVGLFWSIYIFIAKGNEGENEYGVVPEQISF